MPRKNSNARINRKPRKLKVRADKEAIVIKVNRKPADEMSQERLIIAAEWR